MYKSKDKVVATKGISSYKKMIALCSNDNIKRAMLL